MIFRVGEHLLYSFDAVAVYKPEKVLTNKEKRRIRQKTKDKGIWGGLDLTELDLHENTKWKGKSKKKKLRTL